MAELKTKETDADVDAFLAGVDNARRRGDAVAVAEMMARVTGEPARLWGANIVGFGRYAYTYASGHSGEYFLTGVSPRARALSVYIMPGFGAYGDLMDRLGTHKTGRSCLYITNLDKIDMAVLEELVRRSVADMRNLYGADEP
jgi:hypothetical protein